MNRHPRSLSIKYPPRFDPAFNSAKEDIIPMTVCAAAIYNGFGVIGASDRMLTYGEDIQYEPRRTKIHPITNSIVIMTAGDASVSYEAIMEVREKVSQSLDARPDVWQPVADVAKMYRVAYNSLRNESLENEYLTRLGLDLQGFWQNQAQWDSNLVSQIASEMTYYKFPGVAALVCGVDAYGPHIYVVINSKIKCFDSIGFAAVGIGQAHAESHFMYESHTSHKPSLESLYRVHAAKKRAEVSPGVGKDTDMFIVAGTGGYSAVEWNTISELNSAYQENKKRHQNIDEEVYQELNKSEEEYFKNTQQSEQTEISEASTPDGDAPVNEEGISDDTEKS